MNLLYLDTTTSYLYAGVVSEKQLKAQVKEKLDRDLSVLALPRIEQLMKEAHLEPEEIDQILVVNGPGSFTGIRIGVTIAKVYAWALKKPIVTISSLEAMAVSSKEKSRYKVPAIDARRDYVFAGVFDLDGTPVIEEQYIKREDLIKKLEALSPTGDYSWISNQPLMGATPLEMYDPNILAIASKYQSRPSTNPHAVNPEYLKLTEAEENKQVNCS